jgi:hypothetical protein
MDFEILGEIAEIELIAGGRGVRERKRLSKRYGKGRWRKLKGIARIRLLDRTVHWAEVQGYEAHGVGRKEFKFKLPFIERSRR